MRTNRQKHCSLWLCHAIGVLIHGLTDKSDTVVELTVTGVFPIVTA